MHDYANMLVKQRHKNLAEPLIKTKAIKKINTI